MQQKNFFLPQEIGAYRNNRKNPAKATPKIEKIYMLYIYR